MTSTKISGLFFFVSVEMSIFTIYSFSFMDSMCCNDMVENEFKDPEYYYYCKISSL